MEQEKLNIKIARYIELSIQFEQKEISHEYGTIHELTFSGGVYNASKTRLEAVREKAEKEIKTAEEYEEYKTLQKELRDYYKALNNINK